VIDRHSKIANKCVNKQPKKLHFN